MNILIWTDLEGVSGIVDFDAHEPYTGKDLVQRELMTGELNAAIRGCFDAGAESVKVIEGHDATDFASLDPRALFVPARYPSVPQVQGWEGYDSMILIGCHSMAGTPDGVLAHTGNRNVAHRLINGRLVGEIGTTIYLAGESGIRVLLASGDAAACREAAEFSPGITTVAVKTGYDCHHAECLHPERARKAIYDGLRDACSAPERVGIIKPDSPVVFEERYHTTDPLSGRTDTEVMKIVDPYTVRFSGRTLYEAYGSRCGV